MCGVTSRFGIPGSNSTLPSDGRLLRQHVDGRAAEIAALERGDQRVEIDQRASRGVDQERIGLHERELALADQARGRRRQRAMQRQHVGDAQQLHRA